MAKYLPLPKSLKEADKTFLRDAITATEEVFKGDLFGENNRPLAESYTTTDGKYHWPTNKDLLIYVTDITNTGDVRAANTALYQMLERAPEQVSATLPNKFLREEQEEGRVRREAEAEEAQKASQGVDLEIERQKAIHDEQAKEAESVKTIPEDEQKHEGVQKNAVETPEGQTPPETRVITPAAITPAVIEEQKILYQEQIAKEETAAATLGGQVIYYKFVAPVVKETPEVEDLKQQAQTNARKFVEDTIKEFKKRATTATGTQNLIPKETIENISKEPEHETEGERVTQKLAQEELNVAAEQAALTTYEVLTGNSPVVAAAVINKIVSDPQVLNKIAPNLQTQETLKNASLEIFDQKVAQFELAKKFADLPKIDSLTSVESVKVEISDTPQAGFEKFDINEEIISPHIDSLNRQTEFLDTLRSFGESNVGKVKSQLLLKTGAWLDTQITRLPAGGVLPKVYNSEIVQAGLSYLGLVETVPWVAAESSLLGKTIVASGLGRVAGFLQTKLGINLGVKLAAKKAVTPVVTKVTAGLLPKLFAALGTLGGWVSFGLTTVIGYALGKIAEKIPWKQILKFSAVIIGFGSALIAAPIVGLGAAIGVGAGATAVSASFGAGLGGLTLKGAGRGIGRFFKSFAKNTFTTIGIPVLIAIMVFPVLVALILFVINSGAYVVPPTDLSPGPQNAYIKIDKTPNPPGPFNNSDIPSKTKIEYTVTVSAEKSVLTNISFKDDCKVTKSGTPPSCPSPSQGTPTPPDSISPSSPFTFNYTLNFDSHDYDDSTTVNTFTVTADAVEQKGVTSTNSASITIGKAPSACLALEGSWPANFMEVAQTIVSTLSSEFPVYMSKICSTGVTVPILFSQTCPLDWTCYGAFLNGKIYLMPQAFSTENYALFTLAHETGHFFDSSTATGNSLYLEYQSVISPPYICSYRNTQDNYDESFAETIGRYVSNEPSACFAGSFKASYPANWQFANDKIFK